MERRPLSQAADCHAHVFARAAAHAVAGARYVPAYDATLADWQVHWRKAGITHGVLVQPSFLGTDNTQLLAAIAVARDKLRGVAVIDAGTDDRTLALLHAGGIRAIRLNLKGVADLAPFASTPWRQQYRRAHAMGWHVEVHLDAGRLPGIAAAFDGTEVALVLDHFGTPGASEAAQDATFAAAERIARERPLRVKLSAPYRLEGAHPVLLARRWHALLGEGGCVWGSDWPFTRHEDDVAYADMRAGLEGWWPGPRLREVLWDNARRLYAFDPDPTPC